MSDFEDVRMLRQELHGLFNRIQTIRHEIASIRRPGENRDRFASMSDELDAIVESTETATDTIMGNAEAVDELIRVARPLVEDEAAGKALDTIPDHISSIFEACSFQDITGQRITKVVKTLQYIEQRVNALIHIWGEAGLSDVVVDDDPDNIPEGDERRLLNGPQLGGEGVSQSDVDAMFGGPQPDTAGSKTAADTPDTESDSKAKPAPAPQKKPAAPPSAPSKEEESRAPMDQSDIDSLFD